MTKDLALRPQYAQYPNPNPKPELFGQTRPEPDPKSKSPTRQGLLMTALGWHCWTTAGRQEMTRLDLARQRHSHLQRQKQRQGQPS